MSLSAFFSSNVSRKFSFVSSSYSISSSNSIFSIFASLLKLSLSSTTDSTDLVDFELFISINY